MASNGAVVADLGMVLDRVLTDFEPQQRRDRPSHRRRHAAGQRGPADWRSRQRSGSNTRSMPPGFTCCATGEIAFGIVERNGPKPLT